MANKGDALKEILKFGLSIETSERITNTFFAHCIFTLHFKYHQTRIIGASMSISKEEILDLALRYISSDEVADIPESGDLFCFAQRDIPTDRILEDEEGWAFSGYGICKGYEYDDESKPRGKWLWFNYISLDSFPPEITHTKLQPPHIAKCLFSTPSRDVQIRIIKIPLKDQAFDVANHAEPMAKAKTPTGKGEILTFPGPKKK